MTKDINVFILSGANISLAGLNILGWTVHVAYASPKSDSIITYKFIKDLFIKSGHLFQNSAFEHNEDIPFYIYLKKESQNFTDIVTVMNLLRTFKHSRIGTYYPITFNEGGGCIVNAVEVYGFFTAPPYGDLPSFSLKEEETDGFLNYINLFKKPLQIYIKNMLDLYHETFRINNYHIRFILSITILEMLIDSNAELTYRLSRSIAVFLGKTQEESVEIYDMCKKMYRARSKYLHNGDGGSISSEYLLKAHDYARRIIANLSIIDDELNSIRRCLDASGFGANPYNIIH